MSNSWNYNDDDGPNDELVPDLFWLVPWIEERKEGIRTTGPCESVDGGFAARLGADIAARVGSRIDDWIGAGNSA